MLEDYAGRHWSGLLAAYYLPRWRLWWAALLGGEDIERDLEELEERWLVAPTDRRPRNHPTAAEAAAAARDLLR